MRISIRPVLRLLAAFTMVVGLAGVLLLPVAANPGRFTTPPKGGTPAPTPELNVPLAPPEFLPPTEEPPPAPDIPTEEPAPPPEPPADEPPVSDPATEPAVEGPSVDPATEPVVEEPATEPVDEEPATEPATEPAPAETPLPESPTAAEPEPSPTPDATPEPDVTMQLLAEEEPSPSPAASPSPSPEPTPDPLTNLVQICYLLDTDGDSYVTAIEVLYGAYFGVFNPNADPFLFVVLITGGCTGLIEPVVTMDLCVFLDTNRDGVVTQAEIQAMISAGYLFPDSDAKLIALLNAGGCDSILVPVDPGGEGPPPVADLSIGLCLTLDANGDRVVDMGEAQMLTADVNGDGALDALDYGMATEGCSAMLADEPEEPVDPGPPPALSAALCAAIDSDDDGVVTALEIAFAINDGVISDTAFIAPLMGGGCAGYLDWEPDPGTVPTPDPGTDPTPDPGIDPTPDPGTDPTPDPDPDPGTDPGTDPGAHPGITPEPDPDGDPGTDPAPDPAATPATGADDPADPVLGVQSGGGAHVTGLPSAGAGQMASTGFALPVLVLLLGTLGILGLGLRVRRWGRGW